MHARTRTHANIVENTEKFPIETKRIEEEEAAAAEKIHK